MTRGGVGPPDVEAAIHALFGRIRLDLGQFDSARSNLERALAGFAAVAEADRPLRVAELRARGHLALVEAELSAALGEGRGAAALAAATAEARRVYTESRWLAAVDPALALELSSPLAEIYCRQGRWRAAAPLTEEAMALVRRAGAAKTLPVARALSRRALILKNLEDDLEGAHALYAEALAIFLAREGPVHPEVARLHNQMGLVAAALGDSAAAIASHRAALAARRQLYRDGHWEIAQSHGHLGDLFLRRGEGHSAAEHWRQVVLINRQVYGATDGRTVQRTLRLCEVLIDGSQAGEAEALLRVELSPEHRAARPAGSRLILRAEGLLGAALEAQGKAEGEALLHRSLETLRSRPEGYEEAIRWLETFSAKISAAA